MKGALTDHCKKVNKSKFVNVFSRACKSVSVFLGEYVLTQKDKELKYRRLDFFAKLMGTLVWLVYPFMCFLSIEYINFMNPDVTLAKGKNLEMLSKLLINSQSVVTLDLIILYGLSVLLVLLFKHLWISSLTLGVSSVVISTVSYIKYQLRDEYFYPWDIQQAGNLRTMTEYVDIRIPRQVFIISAVLIILTALIYFSRSKLPVKWHIRIPTCVIIVCIIFVTYSNPANSEKLLNKYGMTYGDAALQESNYNSNGFIGAFTLNALMSSVTPPEGYSSDTVENILSPYSPSDAGENFKSPNVILILQESFWKITNLPNCDFSSNPLENFDKIISRDNVYTGGFITSGFGGGTVRPEFETLTGLSTDYIPAGTVPYQYINENIESYPSIFKSLGYSTMAIHPYDATFYLRKAKYPYLSFDKTYFKDELKNISEVTAKYSGGQVSDESFVEYIKYFIEENTSPTFIFGISMEGHQPYSNKYPADSLDVTVTSDVLNDSLLYTLNQYTQSVVNADKALGSLVEYLDTLEEDTILIVYGDHAPTLGASHAIYRSTGYISKGSTLTYEDKLNLFTTPFFIYSNFDTSESTMLKKDGTSVITSYNLMNAALELIDGPVTPMMGFLREYHSTLPNFMMKFEMKLDEGMAKVTNSHKILSYDRINGKKYSE